MTTHRLPYPALLLALLLALAVAPTGATHAAPSAPTDLSALSAPAGAAVGGALRYRSPTLGYSLPLPARWTRVADVRWTPDGPPADLTVATPDRQALLGVLAAPTGGRVYSPAGLSQVGDDLIDQQDAVQGGQIRHSHVTIRGVVFQASVATFRHGGESQADSWMAVLTTVRRRRLYAFAGLVYDRAVHFVVGGAGTTNARPTATPTDVPLGPFSARPDGWPGVSNGSVPARLRAGVAAVPVPTSAAGTSGMRAVGVGARGRAPSAASRTVATPPVPSIHRLGRDACPTIFDHLNPDVVDKNCGFGVERLLIAASFAGITFDPRAADDPHPAPAVNVDGFTRYTGAGGAYALDYPAQWTLHRVQGSQGNGLTLRAPDAKAVVTVLVQPAGAASYAAADLQTLADHAVEQAGHLLGKITQRTLPSAAGAVVALADDGAVDVDLGGDAAAQSRVTAQVGIYHGRVVAVIGTVFHVGGDSSDFGDVQARFFAPFDPLARQFGSQNYDAHDREQQLVLASLASLAFNPGAPPDTRPAPDVSIDGFTGHTDAADGYSLRYPAAWTPVRAPGADLAVRSADKRVSLAVAVQPAGTTVYAPDDLRVIADREIAQIGRVDPSALTAATTVTAGVTLVVVVAANVTVPAGATSTEQATLTVAVAAYRRRLYSAVGVVSSASSDNPAALDFTRSETEQQLVRASLATLAFDPRIGDDPRPAPAAGIDGFTAHANAAQGYTISYPAAWTPVSNQGADFTVRSSGADVALAVAVAPTGGKAYSDADLRAVVDGQIHQIGQAGAISHGATRIGGVTYQTAQADVSASSANFATAGAGVHVVALVTVHNGRVYGVLAIVIRTRGGGGSVNPRYDIDNQLVLFSVATIALQ